MEENTNFKSVALAWLSHKKQYVKKSTYATYCILIGSHIIPFLGEKCVVKENDVQDFVNSELERGLSLKTVKDILVVLKMILRFGAKNSLFPDRRIDVVFPTQREKADIEVMSVSNQRRLMCYVREHFSFRNLGILICLSSGIRIGEICALRWADIDLENTDWVNSYNNTVDKCNYHSNTARSYVELRLTTNTAKNFMERGMRIYGNNFKALAVTYDNSRKGADEPDTPASGGSVLWSGSHNLGYSLDFVLLKGTFANATSTSKIRVTATATNQYSQIHMYKKENQWQATQFATIFADNNWPGVVEFTIGNHLGTLQDNDIVLQGGGLTLTKIELIP